VNLLLSPNNHLFQLARLGRRLPHLILAIFMTFVFVFLAQLTGGTAAIILILLLSVVAGENIAFDPNDPNTLMAAILPDTALEQTLLLIFSFGPIFLILWGWLALVEKRPFWTMGLERAGAGRKYLRGLLVGLVMFVAAVGISAAFGYIAVEEGSAQPQGVVALGGVLLVLLGWIVQGAGEELLARGWLLPVVGARYSPVLGLIVSSLVFAVLHSLNPNLSLVAILNLALFGLFTALYALYDRGLWGVFSIHSIWNWAQGNLLGFEVSGMNAPGGTLFDLMEVGPDVVTGGPFGPEGGLAVTAVLIISCLAVWWLGRGGKS